MANVLKIFKSTLQNADLNVTKIAGVINHKIKIGKTLK